MEYQKLGHSDIEVSAIGFGCCPMGMHGWGDNFSDSEVVKAVHIALEEGVTLFDTADVYGLGTSEEILGKALKGRRDKVAIATKFGVRNVDGKSFYDNSIDWLNQSLDESLARLGTDCIDLYQIHYPDGRTPLVDVFGELERKCEEGKIRSYGISNMSGIDFPMPNNLVSFSLEYSLANRENECTILNLAQNYGLSFLSWGSLGQGVLSGKYDSDSKFEPDDRRSRAVYTNFQGEQFRRNMLLVDKMREISKELDKSLPQIALRWILDRMPVSTTVLVGIKRPRDILDVSGTAGWTLPATFLEELDALSEMSG